MFTTLAKIRQHGPCQEGWAMLLRSLNKTKADDEPISIVQILNSNGIEDALWCLHTVPGYDREIRLYAVWCARQVEHLMEDDRSRQALVVAERYANGEATDAELAYAEASAWDARAPAWDSARVCPMDSSGAYARDAAWACTRDSAQDAALTALKWARASAGDSVRAFQEKRLRELCAEIETGKQKTSFKA